MTAIDWMLLGPVDVMLAVASVVALRRGLRVRALRLAHGHAPDPAAAGRHRLGVAPGTVAQRQAAAAQAVPWSISATARRVGCPPQRPWQPLIRPPVWVAVPS